MKAIFSCLVCCFLASICMGQEQTRLIKFISERTKDFKEQGLLSQVFAIRISENSKRITFSKNTPVWVKDKLADISSLQFNWNTLAKEPATGGNTFILPVYLILENNNGLASLNAAFDFDGDNLSDERKLGQIRVLEPICITRFSESIVCKMILDSSDLTSEKKPVLIKTPVDPIIYRRF